MQSLADTKRELFELAEEPALAPRTDALVDLATALDTEDAFLWAKVDLFEAFGEDAIEVPRARSQLNWANRLEMLRNGLILLPLLITWYGIARATAAYGAMLAADPAAGERPFIELWQGGFGGRTMPFSTIGWLDFGAILLVVVTTLSASGLRRRLDVHVANEEQRVWGLLRHALTHASLHLARRSLDTPARFSEELTKTTGQLDGVVTQIKDASVQVREMLRGAESASSAIQASVEALQAGVEKEVNASLELRQAITANEVALTGITATARELLAVHDDLMSRLDSSLTAYATATDHMGVVVDRLDNTVERQEMNAASFLDAVKRERSEQHEVSAAWLSAAREIAQHADQVRLVVDAVESQLEELPQRTAAAHADVTGRASADAKRFGDACDKLIASLLTATDRVAASADALAGSATTLGADIRNFDVRHMADEIAAASVSRIANGRES